MQSGAKKSESHSYARDSSIAVHTGRTLSRLALPVRVLSCSRALVLSGDNLREIPGGCLDSILWGLIRSPRCPFLSRGDEPQSSRQSPTIAGALSFSPWHTHAHFTTTMASEETPAAGISSLFAKKKGKKGKKTKGSNLNLDSGIPKTE